MAAAAKPRFFRSPAAFGQWLEKNHAKAEELLVGYWKVATGKASLTWAESVEQALRFGWIDGVRRSLGDDAYVIRFTPRRAGSSWSLVNIRLAKQLIADGRMAPAGLAAFKAAKKNGKRDAPYGEGQAARLQGEALTQLKANPAAWAWFQAAAPSYQRACAWWVHNAKQEATRKRRVDQLVACCARGEVLPQYKWTPKARSDQGGATRPDFAK